MIRGSRWLAMVIPLGLAFVLATACGCAATPTPQPTSTPLPPTPTPVPPTPTPEVIEPNYTNASLGFSMWYPGDWIYEEEEDWVMFATSEEVITEEAVPVEFGAWMRVTRWDAEGQTVEDLVEDMLTYLLGSFAVMMLDLEPRTIGGQEGTAISFAQIPGDFEVLEKGFIGIVEFEGWGYSFFAGSVMDDWPEYGPRLETMLDSVGFMGTPRPTAIPTQAFTPDKWEPDNRLGAANLTQVGETHTHSLHVEGDHDWLSFEAEEGTTYVVETSNLGDDIDTKLYLYDDDETLLGSDDDGGDEPWASRLYWTATKEGTFYVSIEDWGGGSAGPGSEYDISFKPSPPTATPTPKAVEPMYTNAFLGISMWYPEDWVYEEGMSYAEEVDTVIFATSEEAMTAYPLETGAWMYVLGVDRGGETFGFFFVTMVNSMVSGEEMEISDPQPCTIGGQEGAIVTFEGTPEDSEVPVRGFVAGFGYEGWGYVFLGVSVPDGWSEHGPDLKVMLDRVQLAERVPTSTPRATPTPTPPESENVELVGQIGGDASDVFVQGEYAYVAGGVRSGFRVIDVSNPAAPVEVGSYATADYAHGVYVSGSYAYVAALTSGLRVVDVSDPASPYEVSFYDTPGWAFDVYVSDSYAYVADKDGGLRVIHVSDPAAPVEVGSYATPLYAGSVYVSGSYVYVGASLSLQVADISDPEAPMQVGFYATSALAENVYVSGPYAYVAAGDAGLFILRMVND